MRNQASAGHPRTLRLRLLVGDSCAVAGAWTAAVLTTSDADEQRRVLWVCVAVATTLVSMERAGLYRSRVCALRSSEVARTICAALLGACALSAIEWLAGSFAVLAPVLGGLGASGAVLTLRWRFARWLKRQRFEGRHQRKVVLVGADGSCTELWTTFNDEPELGYKVAATFPEPPPGMPWGDLPWCGVAGELTSLARHVEAGGLIVAAGALGSTAVREAVRDASAAGLHVQIWPCLDGLAPRRFRLVPALGVPLLYVEPQLVAAWKLVVKRVLDVVLAAVMLPLAAPVVLVAAACIKLEDRGPVLHRHPVVGRWGVPIRVLKLRTMVPDAEQLLAQVAALNERTGGPLFKASHDPRVTKVGLVLRATSIDELPQLWNVLNGTMSLVGPRFAMPSEEEHFDDELRRRHVMRPGITGLWQSEARHNPSFSAYRRLDLYYLENWSLALDLTILANTVYTLGVELTRTIRSLPGRLSKRVTRTTSPTREVPAFEIPAHASSLQEMSPSSLAAGD